MGIRTFACPHCWSPQPNVLPFISWPVGQNNPPPISKAPGQQPSQQFWTWSRLNFVWALLSVPQAHSARPGSSIHPYIHLFHPPPRPSVHTSILPCSTPTTGFRATATVLSRHHVARTEPGAAGPPGGAGQGTRSMLDSCLLFQTRSGVGASWNVAPPFVPTLIPSPHPCACPVVAMQSRGRSLSLGRPPKMLQQSTPVLSPARVLTCGSCSVSRRAISHKKGTFPSRDQCRCYSISGHGRDFQAPCHTMPCRAPLSQHHPVLHLQLPST